jgi:hypothetical protein
VDEMVDTGFTFAHLAPRFPGALCVALLGREGAGARLRGADGGLLALEVGPEEEPVRVLVARSERSTHWVLFPWSPAEDREAMASDPG